MHPGLWVLDSYPRAPFEISAERGPELGVRGQSDIVGRAAEELHPQRALLQRDALVEVLADHALVAPVAVAVRWRPPEDLAEPGGDALGVIGRHRAEQRRKQRLLRDVCLIEAARDAKQCGETTGPLEQRRLLWRLGGVEVGVPGHAAAERLVLRLAAATEAVVLERRAGVARLRCAGGVEQRDAPDHTVRTV